MPDHSQGLICGIYSNLLSKSQDLNAWTAKKYWCLVINRWVYCFRWLYWTPLYPGAAHPHRLTADPLIWSAVMVASVTEEWAWTSPLSRFPPQECWWRKPKSSSVLIPPIYSRKWLVGLQNKEFEGLTDTVLCSVVSTGRLCERHSTVSFNRCGSWQRWAVSLW